MRSALSMLLFCALIACGCAGKKSPAPASGAAAKSGSPVWGTLATTTPPAPAAPATSSGGRVLLVDPGIRCVVLNFPVGAMAAPEQRLNLYRQGAKVGEVKVTGPQREDNTVADVVAGEAQVGDEVRVQ